jgi:CarboxypepD_reg-like domain
MSLKCGAVLFCCVSFLCSYAQRITISGKVVDRESTEPLPFASIGILGKSIGTISNLQGEFDFHLTSDFRTSIVVINMLGYKTFEQPVWALLTRYVGNKNGKVYVST